MSDREEFQSTRDCPGCGQDGTGLESHNFDCPRHPVNSAGLVKEPVDVRAEMKANRTAGKAIHQAQRLEADPLEALAYLLAQYDRLVEVHDQVVMDTPEDREVHDRAVATFRQAVEPIRRALPVMTEPTKQEYLAATSLYRDVPALSAFMAGVVAEMLTPEQRARVIAYMREEEARVGVRS